MSLARDATTSGDPVLAENYLQHAEHYNRIIMAVRDQQIAQGGDGMNGGMPRSPMDGDDYGDDEGDDGEMQPMHHRRCAITIISRAWRASVSKAIAAAHEQNRYRDRDRNDHRNNQPS